MEYGELTACRGFGRVPLAVVVALTFLFAPSVMAVEGRVLDRATGKPIEGAYVIAEWHGVVSHFVEGRSRCYAAAVTVTNSTGHWSLSDFSWNFEPWIFDRKQSIRLYKPGFQRAHVDGEDVKELMMESRTGTRAEQYNEVSNTNLGNYCEGTTRAKAFIAVRKVRAMELRSLATTDAEMSAAKSEMDWQIEIERGGGPQ